MTDKETIVSRSNGLVKKIRKLGLRKYREQFGEYIAEGRRWVYDAVKLCRDNVVAVIRTKSTECDFADYVLSDELFSELSETENNQGIMALMKIPAPCENPTGNYCLYLDRVRDPGNMGTIIRTACAAGYGDIVLRDCVDVYSPKVVRSCMTGILNVNFHNELSVDDLKKLGYEVVCATLDGENIFGARKFSEKICLVIGNEADGVDDSVCKMCTRKVTIPMAENMESLNAAISAGILMYQLKFNR